MPKSLRCKIKKLCYNGVLTERERDRILKALDHRWIPVSESLPEDFENVLVWYEYFRYGDYNKLFQTCGFSYVYEGHWSGFVNGSNGWKDLRIIAWMPLPEPYKGE